MLLYMDMCCFNRPFDNQSQQKIYLETEAKLFIQRKIKDGVFDIAWSYMLDYENAANPNINAKQSIQKWESIASQIIFVSGEIIAYAEKLHKNGFGKKDSLHIACGIEIKAKYFLTVDKNILKKRNVVNDIIIINPIEFITMEDEIYEN
ncbi:MAG: PIN domain protein [Deltaproteobacteria bacterium]|nr:PIN domain protein [Deltaproteobacteria bacterium]